MLIGYARISKADGSQSLNPQRDDLREAGVRDDAIYEDQASGQRQDRPGLAAFLKAAQRKTVVMLPDDATAFVGPRWRLREPTNELYVFVGDKQPAADATVEEFVKAGLHEGTLYGVRVLAGDALTAIAAEDYELGFGADHSGGKFLGSAHFELVPLNDQSVEERAPHEITDYPGIRLQKESLAAGITQLFRPEDGAWDPRDGKGNHFWFVTTASSTSNMRGLPC